MEYRIKRSIFGRCSVRFTGGPVYEDMVDELRQLTKTFGKLLRRWEVLSGPQWIARIKKAASDHPLASRAIAVIWTLMFTDEQREKYGNPQTIATE